MHKHLSRTLALEAVLEVGATSKPFNGVEPLEILVGGDSTCSTHLLNSSLSKASHVLASNSQVQLELIQCIGGKFPRATIKLFTLSSAYNLTDQASKYHQIHKAT